MHSYVPISTATMSFRKSK